MGVRSHFVYFSIREVPFPATSDLVYPLFSTKYIKYTIVLAFRHINSFIVIPYSYFLFIKILKSKNGHLYQIDVYILGKHVEKTKCELDEIGQ